MANEFGARDEGIQSDGAPIVEDPAALAAAEEAARHADDEPDGLVARDAVIDESWLAVASAPAMDPGRSLEPVYEALAEAGIPAGFDPYRPGVASNPYPVVGRLFHVVVPESRADEARAALDAMGVQTPGEYSAETSRADRARFSGWRRYLAAIIALVLVAIVAQLVGSLLYTLGVLR